jgi:cytochrome c-type biogenesis protein CcmH/NrfG
MKPIVVLLFCMVFGTPSVIFGQQIEWTAKSSPQKLNWRQHRDLAEKAVELNKYVDAAQHFETAYQLKPKNLALAHQAAVNFSKARDYRKAAEMYALLLDAKEFPKARLYYAQNLQQSGAFDEAVPEYLIYLNNYNGKRP